MMAEPVYSVTMERLYKRLPEFYRNLDAKTNDYSDSALIDFPFKTWLSGIVDILGDIDVTIERLKYIPVEERNAYIKGRTVYDTYTRPAGLEDVTRGFDPINLTSDLLDARTADARWLVWLSNIVGIKIAENESESVKRDKLVNAYTGFISGSKLAMKNAVKDALTGDKYAKVYDHTYVVGSNLTPTTNEWYVTIVTKATETPPAFDVSSYLIGKGAKPAGVKLYYLVYSISWDTLETNYPTWDSIDAVANWDTLEATN